MRQTDWMVHLRFPGVPDAEPFGFCPGCQMNTMDGAVVIMREFFHAENCPQDNPRSKAVRTKYYALTKEYRRTDGRQRKPS